MLKSLLYRSTLCFDRAVALLPRVGRFRPLSGAFSAWELLQKGKLQGAVIAERQNPGPCPVGSVTERAGMHQHDHQPWPVFWVRSDDARLVGNMLHWRDPDDRLCVESAFHMLHRRRLSEDRFFAQILVPDATRLPGAWTSIASTWADGRNYFHWILDGLPRLMLREQLPEETRILLPARTPTYVMETLEMLGLSHLAQTPPSPYVRPERFYFCSPTAMSGVWNPLGFVWLRKKLARFRSPAGSGPPIFLTRRGDTRVPQNLEEIETIFSERGFQIVDCGSLTVKEQIRITSAAPAIAGLHGAAMTNLLWARPGTHVLEVFTTKYLNACYEQIAFQGGLSYQYHILSGGSIPLALDKWCDQVGSCETSTQH